MWNDRYAPQAGTRSLSWAQWTSRAKSPCRGHIVSVFSHDHFVDNVTRVVILFHYGPCDCFVDSVTRVVILLTLWLVWLFCLQCGLCDCFVYSVAFVWHAWLFSLHCDPCDYSLQRDLCDRFVYTVACVTVSFTVWPVWLLFKYDLCVCFVYSVTCMIA